MSNSVLHCFIYFQCHCFLKIARFTIQGILPKKYIISPRIMFMLAPIQKGLRDLQSTIKEIYILSTHCTGDP